MSPISFLFVAVLMLAAWLPAPAQAGTKPESSVFRNAAGAKAGKTPKAAVGRVQRDSAAPVSARRKLPATRAAASADSRKLPARVGSKSVVATSSRRTTPPADRLAPAEADRRVVATPVVMAGKAGAAAVTVPAAIVGPAPAAQATEAAEAIERAATVSLGAALGLHRMNDPLDLRSGSALVIERETGKVLFEKNPQYVLPIASLTKLMTAMVVLDAGQSFDEVIEVTSEDRDTDRFSASHLPVGARVSRRELLQLALMASENRAAAALARTYPGGFTAYVEAANRKAVALGMVDSVFADGTGLSASNVATVHDLAKLVSAASDYAEIAQWSLAPSLSVRLPRGSRSFHTTNRLVGSPNWQLELQKTGYITEAGNCLLLQARVDNRSLIVVLLDSYGRYSRIGDAERIRRWLQDPV